MNKKLLVGATAAIGGATIGGWLLKMQYPSAPKIDPSKKHIACIGDSITFGNGVYLIGQHKTSTWEVFLKDLIPDDYQILNYGLSARTLMVEGDQPYSKDRFKDVSHEVGADIYIIMLGTNDSKTFNWPGNEDKYKPELKAFVESYQKDQKTPCVYLMQPPKAFGFLNDKLDKIGYSIQAEPIEGPIYNAVAEVAAETGSGLIDLYTLTKDHPEWFPDGIHPNADGNKAIAEEIARVLNL